MMYRDKKVIHIVAVGKNGEIGKDNKMLWHIPEDFKYFKEMTIGQSLIMGRKTYEGLPNGLTRRIMSVVRSDKHIPDPLEYYLGTAITASEVLNTDSIWVVGGQKLYETTSDIVDTIFITRVMKDFPEADTFYKIPEGFKYCGVVRKPVKAEFMTHTGSICVDVYFEKWERENNA